MRSLFLCLLLANSAGATQYVLPVATARYNDRIYTTTVALHNDSDREVRCEFTHRPVNDPARILSSSAIVPAHGNRVTEDFLVEVGAIGSVRLDCTGEILVLARIQDSLDDAKTFRDGRVFRGTMPAKPIVQGASQSITTQSDVVLIEVLGKPATASILVKTTAGAIIGEKLYDLPPRAHQPVNLGNILPQFGTVDVTVSIAGEGGVVTASATPDPDLGKLVVRTSAEPRARANEHFVRQERQAGTTFASVAAEAHAYGRGFIAPMASFKAAPFQEPATGLILMRDRWYDPSTGTFLTPDPEGYDDSSNPYIFGRGDPVNNSDPTGRHTFVKRKVNGLEFELLAPDPDEVREGILSMSGSFVNPFTGKRESFSWDQHQSELLLMQARWGNPLIRDVFQQFFGMGHDQVDVSGLRLYWNSLWHHKTDIALSAGFTVAMLAPRPPVVAPRVSTPPRVNLVNPTPLSSRLARTTGIPESAAFAQTTYSPAFSAEGRFAGMTVDDVTIGLRTGRLTPADVRVDYIVRDGNTLILNTRSAQALQNAGIPRSLWVGVDRTGIAQYEAMVTSQLNRNRLTPAGTQTVRPKKP